MCLKEAAAEEGEESSSTSRIPSVLRCLVGEGEGDSIEIKPRACFAQSSPDESVDTADLYCIKPGMKNRKCQ